MSEALGPEYEAVRGDHYFSLIREAYDLPAKPRVLESESLQMEASE
ncbi:MAG: hypothetical protein E7L01_08830 [Paenibacillus macerans]|nr:hypothetical protein [Paenibacillus macerans]MDU7473449.1 hypothetical protein [Paenibacillus macerans]MEC0136755.1 hypothetical protein [Paenibacillus macerans]